MIPVIQSLSIRTFADNAVLQNGTPHMAAFLDRLSQPLYRKDESLSSDVSDSSLTEIEQEILLQIFSIKQKCAQKMTTEAHDEWLEIEQSSKYKDHLNDDIWITATSVLMHGFQKNHQFTETLSVFNALCDRGICPNVHIYKIALRAVESLECRERAQILHQHIMENRNVDILEDMGLVTTMLSLLGRVEMFAEALSLWDRVMEQNRESIDSRMWNLVIPLCVQHGDYEKALNIYFDFKNEGNFQSTNSTLTDCIKACKEIKDMERGKELHRNLMTESKRKRFDRPAHYRLIDMYIEITGRLLDGLEVWREVTAENEETNDPQFMYRMLISASIHYGDKLLAFQIFDAMDIRPTVGICEVMLRACDSKQLIDEMKRYMQENGISLRAKAIQRALKTAYHNCGIPIPLEFDQPPGY